MIISRILLATIVIAMVSARATADLTAYWSFDNDFTADAGGSAFDLTSFNGATAGDPDGRFGNAARFERANSEYAFTTGDVLNNGPGNDYTYSAWYKSDVITISQTGDRYFVLETTAGDAPSSTEAWVASYGLREDSSDVDPNGRGEVYTSSTVDGSERVAYVPGGNANGGAPAWHNIIVSWDADGGTAAGNGRFYIYLDGTEVASYIKQDIGDPLRDVEGLVIGGHRAGTGRNFDGMIDAVSFYDHVLSSGQIAFLQSNPVIPEPTTLALVGLVGVVGLCFPKRRSRA